MMKYLILINFTLTILSYSTFGQQQHVTEIKPRFTCLSDSITYNTLKELKEDSVEGIITYHYEYDNGRVPESIIYITWIKNNNGFMKSISGLNEIFISKTYCTTEIVDIFNFYQINNIDTITQKIECDWVSHDMGYYITVYTPKSNKYYNIRDYTRKCLNDKALQIIVKPQNENEPHTETNLLNTSMDPRLLWLNKFDSLLQNWKKNEASNGQNTTKKKDN